MNSKVNFDLKDKVIIVTGASGVLGGEVATYLSEICVKVVLMGRTESTLKELSDKLNSAGGNTIPVRADVLNSEDLEKAKDEILEKFGTIDVLINAAGGNVKGAVIQPDEHVFDMNMDDFDKVTQLNLYGSVKPSLVFGKVMAEKKKGNIINFSSMASIQAITRVLGYSVSKTGIDSFTKWMAVEFAQKYGDGLRVNAIAPGFFIAKQNKALLTNEDGTYTERGQKVINNTPMDRFGQSHEILGAIHWLASDASSFVTGTVIPIDGGFSIYSGV